MHLNEERSRLQDVRLVLEISRSTSPRLKILTLNIVTLDVVVDEVEVYYGPYLGTSILYDIDQS